MPLFNLLREINIERTPRVMQLEGLFDVQPEPKQKREWSIELPEPEGDWKIGLIVGPSGSGKSTVANQIYKDCLIEGYEWDSKKSVVDGFPQKINIKSICESLSSVGFNSPPSWLKPFHILSNGEQFRVTLARALCEDKPIVAIDEFTSVIDRTVAKIGSVAVSKAVRRSEKKFIAVSCHYDIEEWLNPDWVLEMPSGKLTRRSLRRRPEIPIEIRRVEDKDRYWNIFKNHHYMSHELARAATCFVGFINSKPIVFSSVIMSPGKKSSWRMHRLVCDPDYQGTGIGTSILNLTASMMSATGTTFGIGTRNQGLVKYLATSDLWKINQLNTLKNQVDLEWGTSRINNKYLSTFFYIGPQDRESAYHFGINKYL